ncbi:TCB1 transposase, partial [Polypterus senegalus]
MIWVCFAASGPGQLAIIEWKTNSQDYQQILQDNVRVSVRQLKLKRGWVMQQDNDPKHLSKSIAQWLQKNKVRFLEWPSRSPDLNPIEMLWNDLKRAIHRRQYEYVRICKS